MPQSLCRSWLPLLSSDGSLQTRGRRDDARYSRASDTGFPEGARSCGRCALDARRHNHAVRDRSELAHSRPQKGVRRQIWRRPAVAIALCRRPHWSAYVQAVNGRRPDRLLPAATDMMTVTRAHYIANTHS
jgi:hypothetical protein